MGEVTRCGGCGFAELTPLLDLGIQPIAERMETKAPRYPLALLQCRRCSLVQLSYIVDQYELFPPEHPYSTGNSQALRRHFARLARELERDLDPGDLVADIGANDGTLLGGYSASVRRVAVEPTRQIERRAAGIDAYQRFFTAALAQTILAEHGTAKVITATNVMAHVPDIHDFAEGIATLLADDGVLVTENHDVASVLAGQIDTIYHEHLRYYSPGSLAQILARHGLSVTATEPLGTHGGTFRTWARRQPRDIAIRAEEAAVQLRRLLSRATAQHGSVYGIGATTRATPLIHFAKLEPYLACVCEVATSDKIGQVMPGTSIPVVPDAKLIADQPGHALLFSWHIAPDIIPKLREAGYRGRIIIPLPRPKVIT